MIRQLCVKEAEFEEWKAKMVVELEADRTSSHFHLSEYSMRQMKTGCIVFIWSTCIYLKEALI